MRTKFLLASLLGMSLLFVFSLDAGEMRKWTRKNGKALEAEFVKTEQDPEGHNVVTLRKQDGTELTVRMGSLSDEDRKYVRQHKQSENKKAVQEPSDSTDHAPAAIRTWTKVDGTTLEASYVSTEHRIGKQGRGYNVITLRTSDGTIVTVRPMQLSKEDKDYLQKRRDSKGRSPSTSQAPAPTKSHIERPRLTAMQSESETSAGQVATTHKGSNQKKSKEEDKEPAHNASATRDESRTDGTSNASLPEIQYPVSLAALSKERFSKLPAVHFSPKGHFVLLTPQLNTNQECRLWHVVSVEETKAKSQGCDYFSFPAAFSPDEKNIACIDGEVLRIWDISATPSPLVCSIPLPKELANNTTRLTLTWQDVNCIVAKYDNWLRTEPQFAVFRRTSGTGFASHAELIKFNRRGHGQIRYERQACLLAPTGRYVVSREPFSPDLVVANPFTDDDVATLSGAVGGLEAERWPSSARISPDGSIFVAPNGKGLTLWDTKTWRQAAIVVGASPEAVGKEALEVECFSADRRLAAISRTVTVNTARGSKQTCTIGVWDLRKGTLLRDIQPEGALSDWAKVASPSSNTAFHVDKRARYVLFDAPAKSLVCHEVLVGWNTAKNTITYIWGFEAWDITTGKLCLSRTVAHSPQLIAVSPDGRTIIVAEEKENGVGQQQQWNLTAWDVFCQRETSKPRPSATINQ